MSTGSQAFAVQKSGSGARRPAALSAVKAMVDAYLEGAIKDQLQASLKAKQQVECALAFHVLLLCQGGSLWASPVPCE